MGAAAGDIEVVTREDRIIDVLVDEILAGRAYREACAAQVDPEGAAEVALCTAWWARAG